MKQNVVFETTDVCQFTDTEVNRYGQRLYELMSETKQDNLTAEAIVEDAKNKSTPYHDYFEWNNQAAGHQFRLQQARTMLGSIKIKITTEKKEERLIRAFHNVELDGERVYAPIQVVMKEPDLREQIIHKALAEAEGWARRYETYRELNPIVKSIKKVVKQKVVARG